jgi:hypothetical protein
MAQLVRKFQKLAVAEERGLGEIYATREIRSACFHLSLGPDEVRQLTSCRDAAQQKRDIQLAHMVLNRDQ